ncbi:hypothetical protein ABPG77_010881 [Micractinium sp. CCAP 211/92]
MVEEALCGGGSAPAPQQCRSAHAALHSPQDGQTARRKREAAAATYAGSKRSRRQQQPGSAVGPSPTPGPVAAAEGGTGGGRCSSGGSPCPLDRQQQQQQEPRLRHDEQPSSCQDLSAEAAALSHDPSSRRTDALAWHAGRRCEALTPAALCALRQLDPASHDLHMRLLRFDDQLAELASRRGLLVRFVVQHSARSGGGARQEPLLVEAPEFMTVEYLKRRVARAKLQLGEVLPTARFVLRSHGPGSGGGPADSAGASGGTSSSGAAGRAFEDLPCSLPNGDEVFLASLGYEVPGPYELLLASAPQTSDLEQQEQLLAGVSTQVAPRRQPQPPVPVRGARLGFRALLQAPAAEEHQGLPAGGSTGGDASGRQAGGAPAAGQSSAGPRRWLSPVPTGQAASNSRAGSAAGARGGPNRSGGSGSASEGGWPEGAAQPRRQGGRWGPDEVAALVEGVQAFGTSWAKIHAAYVRSGRISQNRTQVDLKDKWRNLARAVARGAGPQPRGGPELTEEQRHAIWSIVSTAGGDAAAA